MQSDSPWQLLAACFELNNALKYPNPSKFESCLPIHQDGSCNGLQHYAALGGDIQGAKSVNLISCEKPNDIYSDVARQLTCLVEKDVANGVKEAILMQSRINRKLVKQTVMTNTYGVTFIGAKEQVASRLRESRENDNPSTALTDEEIRKCSFYITKKIFESMGTLFEGIAFF